MHIEEVLAEKRRPEVVTIGPEARVAEVVASLAEHGIGALVVSTGDDAVDGIVSERDVVRRLAADPEVLGLRVRDVMTAAVETCEPTSSLDEVMAIMTERRIRHLPVLSDGRLVGIVSIGDVVKHKLAELQFERDQLDHYVHQV